MENMYYLLTGQAGMKMQGLYQIRKLSSGQSAWTVNGHRIRTAMNETHELDLFSHIMNCPFLLDFCGLMLV